MGELNIPQTMRNARKAVTAGDYEKAALLYTSLMACDDITDHFDIQIRHAWCVEKTGHVRQAIALYQGIVQQYHAIGEHSAAASVEQTIKTLEDKLQAEREAAKAATAEEAARLKAAEEEAAKIREEKARQAREEIERLRREKEREAQQRREQQLQLERERAEQQRREQARLEQERRERILAEERAFQEQLKLKKEAALKARAERLERARRENIIKDYKKPELPGLNVFDDDDDNKHDDESPEATYEIDLQDIDDIEGIDPAFSE